MNTPIPDPYLAVVAAATAPGRTPVSLQVVAHPWGRPLAGAGGVLPGGGVRDFPGELVAVQFFEELRWGFMQHRLQARQGALSASLLVALAFASCTYPPACTRRSPDRAPRDLTVLAIVIPFAIVIGY